MMINPLINQVISALTGLGYVVFRGMNYDLNLVGVRSGSATADQYDDLFICFYRVEGVWRMHVWPGTTDPGEHYLKNPVNPNGAMMLCPGQYRGAYKLGMHRGRPALVQAAPFRVWRDNNRDSVIDWPAEDDGGTLGWQAANFHDHSAKRLIDDDPSTDSAGCQVTAVKADVKTLRELLRLQEMHGNGETVSYSLIYSYDL
jgi:hypothetical protein